MLTSIEIDLQPEKPDFKINYHYGSLLHGVLMETISPDYADKLHANSLRPFTQFVYYNRQRQTHTWKISTLNEEAGENIIRPMLDEDKLQINIRHKNLPVKLADRRITDSTSYETLTRDIYLNEQARRKVWLHFLSPTTFKIDGRFVIWPSVRHVFQSLLSRWNSFYSVVSLQDDDLLDHLIDHTEIISYKLKSTSFGLEGVKISSFKGDVCFLVRGPNDLVRIANLLFAFSNFSGVGAKTALGMGGTRYV